MHVPEEIEGLLDSHLEAVKNKDSFGVRCAFMGEAKFFGTDDREIWSVNDLVVALENSTEDWTLECSGRQVDRVELATFAFVEFLHHKVYGSMRGSGIVVSTRNGWRRAQYVISFSVSNRIAEKPEFLALLAGK